MGAGESAGGSARSVEDLAMDLEGYKTDHEYLSAQITQLKLELAKRDSEVKRLEGG